MNLALGALTMRVFAGLATTLALGVLSAPSAVLAQSYRTVTGYDGARRPVSVTDALGRVSYKAYDADGRVVREASQAPSGQWLVTCTSYTLTGQKAQVVGPSLTGSATSCPDPNAATVSRVDYAYDALDRVDTETVRLGGGAELDRVAKSLYDAAGQVVQVRRAVGTALEQAYATYGYTPNGKQQYVVDANGNRAQLVYDGYDRQVQWIFPSAVLPGAFDPSTPATALASAGAVNASDYEQYGYDANGNRTLLKKRDNQSITFVYDNLNRLTTKSLPGGSGSVAYSYDLRGLQLSALFVSGGQGVSNAYDKAGRLSSSTSTMGGASRTLSYLYDVAGNRVRVTHPDGNYFTYVYDALNRVTTMQENGSATLVVLAYDELSRRSALTRGGGTAGATSLGYDVNGRLSILGHDLAATAYDVSFGFGYNRAGQVVTRTNSNDVFTYTGDVNVSRAYTKNGLNQYTAAGTATFGYDLNGNLTSYVTPEGSTTYVYDAENRLTYASGAKAGALAYDPLGRLYQSSGGASGTTQFLYDGDALVAEYDGSGNLLRRYVHGPGVDEPLIWYEGSTLAGRRYLHANQQGSVIAVTDAAGSPIEVDSYDAWGLRGANNHARFQYTGQIWLPDLELYHYKARAYSPTIGRFMQTDPIGYQDQINLYAYVANDPGNKIDPSGLQTGSGCTGTFICPDGNIKGATANTVNPGLNGAGTSDGGGMVRTGGVSRAASTNTGAGRSGLQSGNLSQNGRQQQQSVDDIVVTATARSGCGLFCKVGRFLGLGGPEIKHYGNGGGGASGSWPSPYNECCFTAGTLVSTPQGLKPIEGLKVGDLVISRSDVTGETAAKPIIAITPAHERHIWAVTISYKGEDGRWRDERYETTDDHPWRTADGHWVVSASLKPGVVLARETGTAIVAGVANTGETKLTYNLEIADYHTYFVGEAATWVHNACWLLTNTVAKNLGTRPYINSPLIIQQIQSTGLGVPDPGGIPGALRYDVPGSFNGSFGNYELVLNPNDNTIYHFLFRSDP